MNSGIDERGSLHFTRLWIRVSVLGTGWEIKNRCTIGRLFCIIRKRRGEGGGEKKESFPTIFETLFLLSLSVWYFAACDFFFLLFLSSDLSIFLSFFVYKKRERAGAQDSKGELKTPPPSPLPLFTWVTMEIKGLFRRHSKEGNPDHRSLVFGAESREKVGDFGPSFIQKRRLNGISINYFAIQFSFIQSTVALYYYTHTHTHIYKKIYIYI